MGYRYNDETNGELTNLQEERDQSTRFSADHRALGLTLDEVRYDKDEVSNMLGDRFDDLSWFGDFSASPKIAIVGAGLAGNGALAGIVRAAVDSNQKDLTVSLFDSSPELGVGPPYNTRQPDALLLNHETNVMGSVNVLKRYMDEEDFYEWIQENLEKLKKLYPKFDLSDANGYVPRNLYGRYLSSRFEETVAYAEEHGIEVETCRSKVKSVDRKDGSFLVAAGENCEVFDAVILATGNWSDSEMDASAEAVNEFAAYPVEMYVENDSIQDGACLVIKGAGLSAIDVVVSSLESGKYGKVIMASRSGVLRRVRGVYGPYERKYLTLENLRSMSDDGKFKLDDVLELLRKELGYAYGFPVTWPKAPTIADILLLLEADVAVVERGDEPIWQSVYRSLSDEERDAIYTGLASDERQLFNRKYSATFHAFHAPMPVTNARKLLDFIAEGKLELVNGVREITRDPLSGKYELKYALEADGTPVDTSVPTEELGSKLKTHPAAADVLVNAIGRGRSIETVPLYRHLIDQNLAEANPYGGIRVCMKTRSLLVEGKPVEGLYAIGQMACGETVLSHNSLMTAELGIKVGQDIVEPLKV